MVCEHEWTVEFASVPSPNGGTFEVRPKTLDFKRKRGQYDYARLKLDPKVGEAMKPHTGQKTGLLRQQQVVYLCFEGERLHPMLYRPENVNYGNHNTFINLTDLHKALDDGSVDYKKTRVNLRDAYTDLFEQRECEGIFNDIKFSVPEDIEEILQSSKGRSFDWKSLAFAPLAIAEYATTTERSKELHEAEQDKARRVLDSDYVIDVEDVSPEVAMQTLNERFRIQTWIDFDRNLWVGIPEANGNYHVAAPDDDRVWRYASPNITHNDIPIKTVVVQGPWVDYRDHESNIDNIEDSFVVSGVDADHELVRQAQGIAYRTDISYGRTVTVQPEEEGMALRNGLDTLAEQFIRERAKQTNTGSVELVPNKSTDITPMEKLKVGDFLHLVPDDDIFDSPSIDSGRIGTMPELSDESCYQPVNNEVYLVMGVHHNVNDNGYWSVNADVTMYPDDPIESKVRFFNPEEAPEITQADLLNPIGQDVQTIDPLREVQDLIEDTLFPSAEDFQNIEDS